MLMTRLSRNVAKCSVGAAPGRDIQCTYLEGHELVVGDNLLHAECCVAEVLVRGQVHWEHQ